MLCKEGDEATANLEPVAQATVVGPVEPFITQTRHASNDPIIARLRDSLTNIQLSELNRLFGRLPQLDERSRAAIQQFADCLVDTMMRPPIESLSDESSNRVGLPQALQRLFQLD